MFCHGSDVRIFAIKHTWQAGQAPRPLQTAHRGRYWSAAQRLFRSDSPRPRQALSRITACWCCYSQHEHDGIKARYVGWLTSTTGTTRCNSCVCVNGDMRQSGVAIRTHIQSSDSRLLQIRSTSAGRSSCKLLGAHRKRSRVYGIEEIPMTWVTEKRSSSRFAQGNREL